MILSKVGKFSLWTPIAFYMSILIQNLEMIVFMIRNCYHDDTIPEHIHWSKLCVELEVSILGPHLKSMITWMSVLRT